MKTPGRYPRSSDTEQKSNRKPIEPTVIFWNALGALILLPLLLIPSCILVVIWVLFLFVGFIFMFCRVIEWDLWHRTNFWEFNPYFIMYLNPIVWIIGGIYYLVNFIIGGINNFNEWMNKRFKGL